MLKRLNEVLPELLLGILSYGIAAQAAGVWFMEDKLQYSLGLWIGILLAMGMAVHMAVVIEDAVSGCGQKKLVAMSLLRYGAVILVFFGIMHFRLGHPIAAFIGILGLKMAAYMQPFIHKILLRKKGSEKISTDKESEQME